MIDSIKSNCFLVCSCYLAWSKYLGVMSQWIINFREEEYEHYMKLIQEIDPAVHATLEKCEAALGAPCIEEAVDIPDMIDDGSDETQGYPIMVIKSWQKEFPGNETAQKELLAYPVKWYKEKASMVVSPITYEERQKFLQGIKAVDPTAYDAIVKVDPTGENHIKRHYGVGGNNASMLPSPIDGLPEFHIDATIILNPWNEMLFTVAHELSHYVLGHFFEAYQLSHRVLGTEKEGAQSFGKKGQKISGQLPFKQTFENARQRVKENECDRMAIIDFGINIDKCYCKREKKSCGCQGVVISTSTKGDIPVDPSILVRSYKTSRITAF